MELLQLISVTAVNDLESRMQNGIAVIHVELDQPQQNWILEVNFAYLLRLFRHFCRTTGHSAFK